MKVVYRNILIGIFLITQLKAQCQRVVNFNAFVEDFIDGYLTLELAPLQLSYVSNIQQIKKLKDIKNQELFFLEQIQLLKEQDTTDLTLAQRLDFDIINYEIQLNMERIGLEKAWVSSKATLKETKLLDETNGKAWYIYYLKKWVDASVNPDAIFQFGLDEIEKVKQEMKHIRENSGMNKSDFKTYLNNPDFYLKNNQNIQESYQSIKKLVDENAKVLFPFTESISELKIDKGTNESLAHVPAYYTNKTFYYNYFGDAYAKRQMGWTYIHEGVPGHHYQMSVNSLVKRSEIQSLFRYYGFIEGWGAYVEQFCIALQACQTDLDDYGKYEWDLVRSVRVALDVGINFYGWSDDKAMTFWQEHIKDEDTMAEREIARMKRWPAQVITYKYGTKILNELKGDLITPEALKLFHSKILKHGDLPLSVLVKRFN